MRYPSVDTLQRIKLTLEILIPPTLLLLLALAFFNRANIGGYIRDFETSAQLQLEEIQILGVKTKLVRQVDSARDLTAALKDMIGRRDKALELLRCQADTTCTPTQTAEVKALLSGPEVPGDVAATLQRSQEAVAASERVIAKVDSARPPSTSDWIVVSRADGDLDEARREIGRLRELFPAKSVETLKRGGWYRTVVHFPTAEEARGQVETIAAGSGRKPYVRALSEWCLDLARESEDVRRCAPPAAG